jgi:hypothetical protein
VSVTSCAGFSASSAGATQSGGPAALSLAIAAASVPIVNVPAGTQTWVMPLASVRVWPAAVPSDGTGVGAGVAGVDDAEVAALADAAGADGTVVAATAEPAGWPDVAAPPQPARRTNETIVTATAAIRGRRGSCIA